MVEVKLSAVRVDLQSSTPVLLLTETEGIGRTLPVFVGAPEATSIALAIQGIDPPRPLTHDLMIDMMESTGSRLERVVITEMRSATYFAELHIRHRGEIVTVSSRPSDAIALAVREHCPIFVSDELMDSEGLVVALDIEDEGDSLTGESAEEVVDQFKEFLDTVKPEDFGNSS